MTEGQLFTGIVKWCRANTETEREAIAEFQQDFAAKILEENISQSEFINEFLPLRAFIPIKRFRRLSFELTQNPFREATRFALIPCKEILTVIDKLVSSQCTSRALYKCEDSGQILFLWSLLQNL